MTSVQNFQNENANLKITNSAAQDSLISDNMKSTSLINHVPSEIKNGTLKKQIVIAQPNMIDKGSEHKKNVPALQKRIKTLNSKSSKKMQPSASENVVNGITDVESSPKKSGFDELLAVDESITGMNGCAISSSPIDKIELTNAFDEDDEIGNESLNSMIEEENIYCCDLCDQRFLSQSALKDHTIADHVNKSIIINGEEERRSSTENESSERNYSCVICDLRFARKSSLINHYNQHPHNKDSNFDNTKNYPDKKDHQNEKVVPVSLVSTKVPANPVSAELQVETVASENDKYKCDICGLVLNRKSSLLWHKSSKHGIENEVELPFMCEKCTRTFESKGAYNKHMQSHSNISKVDKSTIGNDFVNSSLVSEDNNGPYKCTDCDKMFQKKRGLYRHMGYHKNSNKSIQQSSYFDEEEVFNEQEVDPIGDDVELEEYSISETTELNNDIMCNECGKVFKSERSMKIHKSLAHHRQPTVKDMDSINQIADSSYGILLSAEQNLVAEEQVEEDQFMCKYCNKMFKNKRGRSIHSVNQHKTNELHEEKHSMSEPSIYPCKMCEREFASTRSLGIHITSQHPQYRAQLSSNKTQQRRLSAQSTEQVLPPEYEKDNIKVNCQICSKEFPSNKVLDLHLTGICGNARIGDDGQPLYECSLCEKKYAHPKSMVRHTRDHEMNGDFKDQSEFVVDDYNFIGGEEEVVSSEPMIPEKTTSGKEYKCKICSRIFFSGKGMAGHMKMHTRDEREAVREPRHRSSVVKENLLNEIIDVNLTAPSPIVDSIVTRGGEGDGNISNSNTPPVKLYHCPHCPRVFDKRTGYAGHQKSHKDKDPAKIARKSTVSKSVTEYHDSTVSMNTPTQGINVNNRKRHNEEVFKCDYCDQTFMLHCHLQKHLKSRCNAINLGNETIQHVDENISASPTKRVRKMTTQNPMFEYDTREEAESESNYRCQKCDKQYTTKQGLNKHALSVHKIKMTSLSEITDVSFSFQENGVQVGSEIMGQFRPHPHECVYCGTCFDEKKELLDHVRCHPETEGMSENQIQGYADNRCVIESEDGDEEHFVFEQFNENEGYECSVCREAFQDKLQIMVHMSHHLRKRNPNGEIGGLVIRLDTTLLAPFECRFCDQRFINKTYRLQHLKRYHGERVLQCDQCNKLFLSKEILSKHCKQHDLNSRHQCEYCKKYFTSKWFLKRHAKRQCHKKPSSENSSMQPSLLPAISITPTKSETITADILPREGVDGIKIEAGQTFMYSCESCTFENDNREDAQRHNCEHQLTVPIVCDYCMATFHDHQSFINHMETHVEEPGADVSIETKYEPSL